MTRLALVAAALVAAVAPLPPALVERWYSSGAYLALQPWWTGLSNRVPYALFDVLIVGAVAAWGLMFAVDLSRRQTLGGGRVVGRFARRTIVAGAAAYLAFLAIWGLNYRREPLIRKVPYDAARVTPDAARALFATTVERLNALHDPAHARGWGEADAIDPALADAFAQVLRRVGVAETVVPGRPKRTLLQWYFRRAAVSGMTDPYFLETLVNADLLPFERPLTVAHEWAHLAGFADEGEANFVGWLTTRAAGPADEYSGWLFLYGESARAVPRDVRERDAAQLAAGPRADLLAVNERLERETNPIVADAGWRVYDRYLRANRVEAGAASYAQVVQLILGTGTAAE
jgi:hypothetical protein